MGRLAPLLACLRPSGALQELGLLQQNRLPRCRPWQILGTSPRKTAGIAVAPLPTVGEGGLSALGPHAEAHAQSAGLEASHQPGWAGLVLLMSHSLPPQHEGWRGGLVLRGSHSLPPQDEGEAVVFNLSKNQASPPVGIAP
ncbi:hypothetical protein IP76_00110, partial [Rhizobium sp. AAP43]